eukprot:gene4364-14487_t
MGILEKIKEIEFEMQRTQKNKATEYHLGLLKAKGEKGEGFEVQKYGDGRVALIAVLRPLGSGTARGATTLTASEIKR